MKKLLTLLLALLMVFSLVACAVEKAPEESKLSEGSKTSEEEDDGYPTPEELKEKYGFKMGFIYSNWEDATGKSYKFVAENTCDALGVETVFAGLEGYDADARIAAVQNLIEVGCDAIWCGGGVYEISQLCEENGVIQMTNDALSPAQPDLNEYIASMEYFGGVVTDNSIETSMKAADALYNAGCRNVALVAVTPGISEMLDNRAKYFIEGVKAHNDMELVIDYYGMPKTGEYNEAVTQWISMYPELDGIYVVSNDGGAAAAIYAAGVADRIKLATYDFQDGMADVIKDGICVWNACGQENTIAVEIILAYNQLLGHDLVEDNTFAYARPFLQITDIATLHYYERMREGEIIAYDAKTIRSLIKEWNPDITIDDIVALNDAYCFEDIAERSGIAIK